MTIQRSVTCVLISLLLLAGQAFAGSSSNEPKDVAIKADDGVLLKGSFYALDQSGPGFLFFQQCSRDRSVWRPLAERLNAAGFQVLIVSPRGQEDSAGERWDYDGSLEHALKYWREKWEPDAEAAYRWFAAQPGVQPTKLASAGAGCGAFLALLVAQQHFPAVQRLVQFSGFDDAASRAFVERATELAIYNTASSQDPMSADSGALLKKTSKNKDSRWFLFPEQGHGIGVLEKHPEITADLMDWLQHSPAVLPPRVQLPADLNQVLANYEAAWQSHNPKALSELFAEDGFVLTPDHPPARGRAEILAVYGHAGGALSLHPYAYAVEGHVAYIIGGFSRSPQDEDGGKFTLTLRKTREGRWLIVSDMDNGNRPRPCTN